MAAPFTYHRANPAEPDRTVCAREVFGSQTVDRETLDRLTAREAGRPCPTCWPTLVGFPFGANPGDRFADQYGTWRVASDPTGIPGIVNIYLERRGPQHAIVASAATLRVHYTRVFGRCAHTANGVRCAAEVDADGLHEGPHLYRCASPDCPGFPWRASNGPHPCNP